jgi:acyl-CoA thioester hydrolase
LPAPVRQCKVSNVSERFSMPIVPRYAEIDQQGVVFNGHYLTWFDEASTGFFDHVGVTYPALTARGLDVQVVHAEIDYFSPIRWHDAVGVGVRCSATATTSFTLAFDVWRVGEDGEQLTAVRGSNVYVVVSTRDWTKREIPGDLRAALTSVAAQGPPIDGTVAP